MRQGRSTYVFPGSNTPLGFQSFYRQGLKGLENVFILKGSPGSGKSTLIRKIGIAMLERGYDIEFWQCTADNESLDGIVIKSLSTAIVDGTAPHAIDPAYPGAVDEIINLGEHWSAQNLRRQKQAIIQLSDDIADMYESAKEDLSTMGIAAVDAYQHGEAAVDKNKLKLKTGQLLSELFSPAGAAPRHLFASAVTPRGLISFADALSKPYPRRYILNGPPGCGKEQLLQTVADAALERGVGTEIFHNALSPQYIEVILLPELGIALADLFLCPRESRPGDITIDFNELSADGQEADLPLLRRRLTELADIAAVKLNEAKSLHDKLESCYNQAMDFEAIDLTGKRLFNRILT
ncbi:MAG: hypothetical protein RR332_06050, partial [Clostridiales bacterium]